MRNLGLYVTFLVVSTLVVVNLMKNEVGSAQEDDCGNELVQQFTVGDIGWVNLEPPLAPVNLRDSPGGNRIGQVEPGSYFQVIDGPTCTRDGISWWQVDTPRYTGWLAEGLEDRYFVARVAADNTRFFLTQIELDATAPVIDSFRQIEYSGAAGGGCSGFREDLDFQYSYFDDIEVWNVNDFKPGEQVQISIYRPDGSLSYQVVRSGMQPGQDPCTGNEGGEVGLTWGEWQFLPSDPSGKWTIEFVGEQGNVATYTTLLVPHSSPWVTGFCEANEYQLLFDGFNPDEKVKVVLVEVMTENFDFWTSKVIEQWEVTVDQAGQLVTSFSSAITPSEMRYFIITSETGEVLGNQQSFLSRAFGPNFQFASCESQHQTARSDQDESIEIRLPYIEPVTPPQEFVFWGKSGQMVDIKLERVSYSLANIDPMLRLISPDGQLLTENDDAIIPNMVNDPLDSHIDRFTLPETGLYTVVTSAVGDKGKCKLTAEYVDAYSPPPATANQISATPFLTSTPAENMCPGLLPPRLVAGKQGQVIDTEPNNIRAHAADIEILGQIPSGAIFNVLAGPVCPPGSRNVWWKVEYNGISGWTAESGGGVYWLEPITN